MRLHTAAIMGRYRLKCRKRWMCGSLCSRGMEADIRAMVETMVSVKGMNSGRERVVEAVMSWSTAALNGGSSESNVSI